MISSAKVISMDPGDLDLAPDAMHDEISRTGRFTA
jgi:hypothetical protein